jgi:hypothetical protein
LGERVFERRSGFRHLERFFIKLPFYLIKIIRRQKHSIFRD